MKSAYPWGCLECLSQSLEYTCDGPQICKECGSENVVEEGTTPVNLIPLGVFPNGVITDSLGWAGIHIFEKLGIASTIGLTGFKSLLHFKRWAVSHLPQELGDMGELPEWSPVEIELYECWMPSLAEQFSDGLLPQYDDEPPYSYKVWRISPDPEALVATKRKVYALKSNQKLIS